MDIKEIKYEFQCDSQLQCRSCLSIGRKLMPLGQYVNIYVKLTADLVYPNILTKPVEICWECQSILRKVLLFQQKVNKACELYLDKQQIVAAKKEMTEKVYSTEKRKPYFLGYLVYFSLQWSTNFINGSLSNLNAITLNDTHHTVYVNECNVKTHSNLTESDNILFSNGFKERETADVYRVINKDENKIMKHHENDSKRNKFEHNFSDVINIGNIELNRYSIDGDTRDSYQNVHDKDLDIMKSNGTNIVPLERHSVNIQSNANVSFDINVEKRNNHVKKKVNVQNKNSSEEDYIENDLKITQLKFTDRCVAKKPKSKKSKSRWAIKRAEQNKKPKFKIVSTDFEKAFTKVQMNDEELEDCIAKERDGEYYKSKRFKCEICILGFVDEKEWLIHRNIHHDDNHSNYICDICKTKITDKRHLSGHIAQHYKAFKCAICQIICRNEDTSNWHFQKEHKKVFQCLKCGLKFSNRREFYKHYKDWHEKYVCDVCGVTFKMRYCIKDHIRKQHSPFTCLPCNKTFSRYNGLWLHKKLAHSPASPPAYCVECDTTYKNVYRYKWHLCNSAKHTQKKKVSIPCPDCKKTFTKKIYMKDHHNLVHLNMIRYRCEQCDKNFIRNAELVKHRRRKHEGVLPPRDKICYLCGRGFTTNKILRNHLRTHETQDTTAIEDKSKEKYLNEIV